MNEHITVLFYLIKLLTHYLFRGPKIEACNRKFHLCKSKAIYIISKEAPSDAPQLPKGDGTHGLDAGNPWAWVSGGCMR